MKTERKEYVMLRGDEVLFGWLFPDNVLYWLGKGYEVKQVPWSTYRK